MHPDHPAAGSAFTTERNGDAQCPQKRRRATQAASEPRGGFWANRYWQLRALMRQSPMLIQRIE